MGIRGRLKERNEKEMKERQKEDEREKNQMNEKQCVYFATTLKSCFHFSILLNITLKVK